MIQIFIKLILLLSGIVGLDIYAERQIRFKVICSHVHNTGTRWFIWRYRETTENPGEYITVYKQDEGRITQVTTPLEDSGNYLVKIPGGIYRYDRYLGKNENEEYRIQFGHGPVTGFLNINIPNGASVNTNGVVQTYYCRKTN